MIKKEDVVHINKKASQAPFAGSSFAYDAINQLSYALFLFRKKYENKKYNLILSNGEEIVFEIKNKDLARLLGVDLKTIFSDKNMKHEFYELLGIKENDKISSFEVLSKIVENADLLIEHDEKNENRFLNYYRMMAKSILFNGLPPFEKFDYGIVNFDKERFQRIFNRRFGPRAKKYLMFPTDEEEIQFCFLGLAKDNETNVLVPEVFLTPTNFQNYLFSQELLLPEELIVDDKKRCDVILPTKTEKIQLLNLYKSIIEMYKTRSSIRNRRG